MAPIPIARVLRVKYKRFERKVLMTVVQLKYCRYEKNVKTAINDRQSFNGSTVNIVVIWISEQKKKRNKK